MLSGKSVPMRPKKVLSLSSWHKYLNYFQSAEVVQLSSTEMITYLVKFFKTLEMEALYTAMFIENLFIHFGDTPTGMLHIKIGSIMFLLNFGTHLPEYTVS